MKYLILASFLFFSSCLSLRDQYLRKAPEIIHFCEEIHREAKSENSAISRSNCLIEGYRLAWHAKIEREKVNQAMSQLILLLFLSIIQ